MRHFQSRAISINLALKRRTARVKGCLGFGGWEGPMSEGPCNQVVIKINSKHRENAGPEFGRAPAPEPKAPRAGDVSAYRHKRRCHTARTTSSCSAPADLRRAR